MPCDAIDLATAASWAKPLTWVAAPTAGAVRSAAQPAAKTHARRTLSTARDSSLPVGMHRLLPLEETNPTPCCASRPLQEGVWRHSALERRSRSAGKWGVARLRTLALLACAGAALGAGSAQAAKDPYASLLAPPAACGTAAETLSLDRASAVRTMLCLTNYARTRSGLEPLRANPLLAQAGQAKLTADLACGEFSHTPCGKSFLSVFTARPPRNFPPAVKSDSRYSLYAAYTVVSGTTARKAKPHP